MDSKHTDSSFVTELIRLLKEAYPEPVCALGYEKDYELLFAARLSAQCTDARVNTVTPILFTGYPTLESLAGADAQDIERIIFPCGFYKIKARDIIQCAAMLVNDFGGRVPGEMEQLLLLPGVGRKTANLILGDIFGKPAVVADTHCIRISNKLGLADSKDPVKVEAALRELLPPGESSDFCHRLVLHGRAVCTARSPKCGDCCLNKLCRSGNYSVPP